MLTFLRKIRQSLIESGSARKYMLYSIGEIALVVIGILIALQINNWNEWRKDRKDEVEILNEIQENIRTGIESMQDIIDVDHLIMSSQKVIINHLYQKLPYHDSLSFHFFIFPNMGHQETPSSGYQTLKSKGLDLIQNDSLRAQIINIYDMYLPWIVSFYETDAIERWLEIHNSELYEHFYVISDEEDINSFQRIPFNYDELLEDNRFKSMVTSLHSNRKYYVSRKLEILERLKDLDNNIQDEVIRLNSKPNEK